MRKKISEAVECSECERIKQQAEYIYICDRCEAEYPNGSDEVIEFSIHYRESGKDMESYVVCGPGCLKGMIHKLRKKDYFTIILQLEKHEIEQLIGVTKGL